MNVDFHQTSMGRQFYEHTMPTMVQQLTELTKAVQQLVGLIQQGLDADSERAAKKDAVKQNW